MKSIAMNRPDERLVYLSFKNIFTGPDAHLRSLKTIRKPVQKYKDKEEIKALIQQHNLDHICNTAKSLLESEVSESTLKVKIRFPERRSLTCRHLRVLIGKRLRPKQQNPRQMLSGRQSRGASLIRNHQQ